MKGEDSGRPIFCSDCRDGRFCELHVAQVGDLELEQQGQLVILSSPTRPERRRREDRVGNGGCRVP